MASPYDAQYASIRSKIEQYANRYGIDPAVGIAQIWQESRFSATACSGANACGIAQFIPGTAERYGVNRNDVDSSLDGWGRYMRDLLQMFGGRYDIALAGYNWGENRAELRNARDENRPINSMPSETRNYLRTILGSDGISYGTGSPIGNGSGGLNLGGDNTAIYVGLGFLFLILVID